MRKRHCQWAKQKNRPYIRVLLNEVFTQLELISFTMTSQSLTSYFFRRYKCSYSAVTYLKTDLQAFVFSPSNPGSPSTKTPKIFMTSICCIIKSRLPGDRTFECQKAVEYKAQIWKKWPQQCRGEGSILHFSKPTHRLDNCVLEVPRPLDSRMSFTCTRLVRAISGLQNISTKTSISRQ